eukprot:148478_1
MSGLFKAIQGLINQKGKYTANQQDNHGKKGNGLCLIYAMNCLLGEDKYTKSDLDAIQYQLSPDTFNKKQGHYDANVLMVTLQQEGINTKFYDVRNAELFTLNRDFIGNDFIGFVVNFKKNKLSMFDSRSWRTIKPIDGVWYDFDRKLNQPKAFKSQNHVNQHLVNLMTKHSAQLIICRWSL